MKKFVRPLSLIPRPRFMVVLMLLMAILVLAPALQIASRPTLTGALAVFGLVVPLIAVAAAGDTGRPRNIASALAGLTVLTSADTLLRLSGIPPQLGVAMSMLFLAYASGRLITGVLRSPRVTGDVLAGAISGYIMLGLTWAFAYGLLETVRPGSIRGLEAAEKLPDFATLLYFSFITQLSIGYGDITPVSPVARTLAVLEGLTGMIFTTIILAALVAGHLTQRDDRGGG